MNRNIKEKGGYRYIEEGEGDVMLLLHGLFGSLSNWDQVLQYFAKEYRVIIPILPMYDLPVKQAGLDKLVEFIEDFIEYKNLDSFLLMGNSLGGHIALMYVLKKPERIIKMILTGSSGLFENAMGGSFPKRGSFEYVKERVEYTFYDPKTANSELLDEIFETTKSIPKCLRIVAIAKSAQRNNLARDITRIKVPTLLVWGLNDTITPPSVGHEFNRLIPGSELAFIDRCCHAPMMERPEKFNLLVDRFISKPNAA